MMGATMKTLVLAEKPSVGKELARVLGCPQGGKGWLEGGAWIVTWAMGHLVELADPESYDERWKTWNLESLPMLPQHLRLVRDPPQRPPVQCDQAAPAPPGRGRAGDRHRRRAGGGAGGALDPAPGRLEGRHPPPVDRLPDRRGHPRGLPGPEARRGLRQPVPRRGVPGRGRLGDRAEPDARPELPLRHPPFGRPGADPHPGAGGRPREGDRQLPARGLLDGAGRLRPVPRLLAGPRRGPRASRTRSAPAPSPTRCGARAP